MPRIDAHQHFWKYQPLRDQWITGDMGVLRKDYLPGDLHHCLEEQAMDGCSAVQVDQSLEENAFLLELATSHAFVKGVVGWVDLMAPDVEDQLAHYAAFPLLKGFRHILQGEVQRDLMLRPDFMRGIELLNRYHFTYDILIYADQLPYALELAQKFPNQPFVLDHMAKPDIKGHAANGSSSGLPSGSTSPVGGHGSLPVWSEHLEALAKCPNVWCKVSGMVTEADWKGWKPEDFRPFLDKTVEAFGTKRLMYGSDWPVCLLAAPYNETIRITNDYFAAFSPGEKSSIFGGNAAAFYHIL
jgi:L-fuconolactonase